MVPIVKEAIILRSFNRIGGRSLPNPFYGGVVQRGAKNIGATHE